jgi:rhamnosyl/mannosyltransferase
MACGKPVISTALATGVPWVNASGLVVPVGDVEALRDAMARLAADPALASRLGALGEARARTEFSLPAMADRLVAVCRELAGVEGSG